MTVGEDWGPIVLRRGGTPADWAACADLWLEGSLAAHDFIPPEFWRAHHRLMAEEYLPESEVWLAVSGDGPLAAFAALRGDHLAALFVRPALRGRGLGRKLLDHLFAGHGRLTLSVYEQNQRAVDFYRKTGFVETGRGFCGHTGRPELAMVWRKK